MYNILVTSSRDAAHSALAAIALLSQYARWWTQLLAHDELCSITLRAFAFTRTGTAHNFTTTSQRPHWNKWEHAAAEWMGVGVSQWREVPEGGTTMAMIALQHTLEQVTERRAVKRDRALEALTAPLVALLWRSDDPIVDVEM